MKNENNNIKKLCSFYVSDWHLATMLLPYINRQVDENAKVITILEHDIQENIKTLVQKLNLKNEKEILEIRWTNINSKKYDDIQSLLKKEIKNRKKILF